MPYFEGKWELYEILCLAVIPLISCLLCGFGKPKHIWHALWVNLVLFLAVSAIFYPYHFQPGADDDFGFATGFWWLLFVPMQTFISLVLTGVGYFVKKRKRR